MMDFVPSETVCEIYSDGSGNLGERFASKIQKAASSGITETVQITVNSESYMFEAVYDSETGEFVHCYDKYESFEEYTASQNECLTGYSLVGNINWNEYYSSEENNSAEIATSYSADNSAVSDLKITKQYSPSESEKSEIQTLLNECKNFLHDYIDCKEIKQNIDESSFITTQETADNGMYDSSVFEKKWFKIVSGDIVTMSDLQEKMSVLFTDNMTEKLCIDNYYIEKDGVLYLSELAGNDGGLLGTDAAYITSVGEADEDTIILYMTAFGDKDNWDLPDDFIDNFTVQLKRTDGGFKMDECESYDYIAWAYSSEKDSFNSISGDETDAAEFDSDTLFSAIDSFDWVSEDNKPCLTSNMFANECKVFVTDINNDNVPEILLTDVYSPREASYTEVFGLSGNELSSMGGFWGYVFNENGPTNIYENSSGETVFIS
jgi:hypothetical protein